MKRPFIISISDNLRYLKLILPLLIILEFSTPAQSQPAAITNVTASSSSFCDGGALTVSYTVVPEGSFSNDNVFTAELSNGTGSFSSPVTIGTLVSINSGNISAVIPPGTGYGTQYRIRVISSNPVVTSDPNTSDITVNVSPTPPSTGTITQPTCVVTTGSVVLSDLPSSGTWTLTRNPGAVTSTGTGTTTTVSDLAPGFYTFTVKDATGCESASTGNVIINAVPSPPAAPVVGQRIQPTCPIPTGSVDLSGLPPSGSWTLTRNPGAVTITGTGITTTVSNLAPGTYTFTITDDALCVSPATGNVVINAVPSGPTAPVIGTRTQPTCAVPTGSVVLNGLPSSGTWTLTRNPGAVTSTGTGTTTTVSDLAPGTYTFTVTDAT